MRNAYFKILIALLTTLIPLGLWSQTIELQFYIADQDTKRPVTDVHVFVSNSSYGTTSTENGLVKLSIPDGLKEDLILSHVSYDTKVLSNSKARKMSTDNTIFMSPNGINLDEILVTQKRSKSWKKNFKQFSKAFLGDDKIASKCEILNPEVLRFSNKKGVFEAVSVDLIKIRNDYLGYEVDFLLNKLVIDKDGSMKYLGHAKFKDNSTPLNHKKIKEHRQDIYRKSPKHFFEHLIKNQLEEGKYRIRMVRYFNGAFELIKEPRLDEILYYDSISNHYLLIFEEFLEIKHLGFTVLDDYNSGVSKGRLESTRFNFGDQGSSTKITVPVSYIYKLTPNLVINQYGNVVNHKAVQEYGYWATQRLAHRLPLDYGNDYSTYRGFRSKEETDSNEKKVLSSALDQTDEITSYSLTKDILYGDQTIRDKAFDYIRSNWDEKYIAPLLDIHRINQDRSIYSNLSQILKEHIGTENFYEGLRWVWKNKPEYDKYYGKIKAEIYQHIDPKFKTYFEDRDETALIGLDEIVWGGVLQDGIPPLRYPKMIDANSAGYLSDSDVVFGVSIDGDHRAYPKRILAWHEFFVDNFANKKIAGVYCTLCGTMIAYDMIVDGQFHDLGTSGFLYNSNKLMYDKATQSLWSTIEGIPVLGPLSDKGIVLEPYSSTTTTWKQWKKMHPDTKVLALPTEYDRNYDEGEAYKEYFSTDKLMFPVPQIDNRLRNKDEVLVIRTKSYQNDPLAISINYLRKNRLYQGRIYNEDFVVLSEKDGMSRVYQAENIRFKSYKKGILKDQNGLMWNVSESHLESPQGVRLERLPSHNVFWFAWYNVFPSTRLVK